MKYKFVYLIFSTLFFSVVYSLIRPRNFHGLNKIQDKIQDVLVEVETDVIEPFASYEDTKQVKQDIKKNVLEEKKKIYNPTWGQRYLDSLYFSVITSCLLGYGDIYPITNLSKIIVSFQGFVTLFLILN
jgi:hypothetical protein